MEEIGAGTEFLSRLNDYHPVRAACWLREQEDEERYLYVALDGLSNANVDVAYGEILGITGSMKDHYLDPFRVKLISTEDSVARAVQDVYRRYPGRIPASYSGRVFAGRAVAEVYIYPEVQPNL